MSTPITATIAELEARIAELSEQNQTFFAAGTQNTKAHYEIARPLLLARQALYAAKKAATPAQEG
jgi:hypothetical protein